GIGYEVIIKTLSDSRLLESCTPIVYGSPKVAAYHRKALDVELFSFNQINHAKEASAKRVNIINCVDEEIRVELGRSTREAGEASLLSLQAAVRDLKAGDLDVIVTAPINKENIQSDKFKFAGHTEFFANEFGAKNYMMLMVSDDLRVGVVTGHIPLNQVPQILTKEKILTNIRILHKTILEDFSIRKPRIAVLGLNPHAGDKGVIGSEDQNIIHPAIKQANEEGIIALGPYPADGFFGSGDFRKFDAILAMYHDQGLIPFKVLAFETGVNFTAGLPIVRTSPGHGTAYDIAGTGVASEISFRNAVYLAIDVYESRKLYRELSKNPLRHHEIDRTGGE
ncbi:MAG: 4-hydroxythreonine-4-phosphate dehydrogenase PdxA, partial [Marinilabiliales bacterium]|nr:4-hydroxythreonine-4-phosphate dehydrogenase PdxA [Marinilabiliales bacterium]